MAVEHIVVKAKVDLWVTQNDLLCVYHILCQWNHKDVCFSLLGPGPQGMGRGGGTPDWISPRGFGGFPDQRGFQRG